jgi:toxin ParE1/3/4
MEQISLTRAAEQDLMDIYLFGAAEFGAKQADRYAGEMAAKLALIAGNPSFGADYTFVQNGLRRAECGAHAIYYRQAGSGILVLRILHGRMDVGRHLG